MENLHLVLLVFQVCIAFSLIGFILIQHGKGADAGVAFGSAASSTVFGSQGSGNFMTRTTAVLAFLFLANSLCLGYLATQRVEQSSTMVEDLSVMLEEEVVEGSDESAMDEPSVMLEEVVGGNGETVDEDPSTADIPSVPEK